MSPEPFRCPPLTFEILDEYEDLVRNMQAPRLRAWVRETDKACRANLELLKEN